MKKTVEATTKDGVLNTRAFNDVVNGLTIPATLWIKVEGKTYRVTEISLLQESGKPNEVTLFGKETDEIIE